MSDEEEYLINTRQKRSNAGSRLRQLLDLEGDSNTNQVSRFVDEDDENVNLLFQEDDEDGEFMEEEDEQEEEEEGGEEQEEDVEEDTEPRGGTHGEEEQVEEQENEEEEESGSDAPQVDSDDVLSDSDMSLSDTDEEEGEKALETEERRKKRRQKQQSKLIPKIKKFKPADPKKTTKPKKRITSEALMIASRRASSRSSVIENKEALVEKLKKDEERRASTTPIVREKQRDLTQEEKLAEAVETEKANVLSLELFKQQEIVKKERQKQMFQQKRQKLVNVVRYVSKQQFITPNDEIEYARGVYSILTGKYKKRALKRLKELVNLDISKYPGDIDRDLPYYKEEMKALENEKAANAEKAAEVIEADKSEKVLEREPSVETETTSPEDIPEGKDEQTIPTASNDADEVAGIEKKTSEDVPSDKVTEEENDSTKSEAETNETRESEATQTANPVKPELEDGEAETQNGSAQSQGSIAKADSKGSSQSRESTPSDKKQKKVSFVDGVKESEVAVTTEENTGDAMVEETPEPSEEAQPEVKKEIFEGPAQRVCRNNIHLIDFDIKEMPFDENKIRKVIFGEQSLFPAPRRFKDLKTILRIGTSNNPYAKTRVERDELFEAAAELTEDDPMFEELNRLPKLGIRQEVVEEVVHEEDNDAAIILNTEAPIGLHLPNGNKKLCLITGTEVRYFDPSLGVPYSDVETFRFLKSMEQGSIPWYSFDSTYNDTGATELYLGSRDGSTRCARGVPEGFEG